MSTLIEDLEHRRWQAMIESDLPVLEELLHPNLRYTHSTAVVTRNNTCISTTCSWQSPKDNYVHAIFEDAIISYDFQKLIIYSPRDTFDSDGYFVKPPQESFNSPHHGVTQSVQSFLEKAFLSNSSGHLSEFHLSKLTCELIS